MFIDKDFHRFDLDEITGDKTHHFVFRRNNEMKCVMQYKLKRYSDALYPRAYKALGAKYVSPTNGVGVVTNFEAFKDECKKKFWTYTVLYSNPATGTTIEEKVTLSAKDTSILMFPKCEGGPASLPDTFPLATFRTDFSENVEEQKQSIQQIFKALNLCETHANDLKHWQEYFDSMPNNPENVTNLKPFIIPNTFLNSAIPNNTNVRKAALPIDDGIRDVDPVTFRDFNPSSRRRALKTAETEVWASQRMDELAQGMFIILDFGPTSEWYPWDFLLAEIDENISHLDTTSKTTTFQVQIYRPSGNVDNFREMDIDKLLSKVFIKWQGEDNKFWRPTIVHSDVKAIVDLRRSGKLSKDSKQLIKSTYFVFPS